LATKRNISQLLNVRGYNDVRLTKKKHTAEPLVYELNVFDFEFAIEKPKRSNHQIPIKFQLN
jgi:hypothetical protein